MKNRIEKLKPLINFNKELSSKGIQTIQIQKDTNTILYIGNNN